MKKILIVKVGAIGDVVMTLPLLSEIKKEFPDAEIHWIAGRIVASLVEATGLVKRLYIVEENELFGKSRARQIGALFRLWKELVGKRFDLILTFHIDSRYQLLSWVCRSPDRRKFGKVQGRLCPLPGRRREDEHIRLWTKEERTDKSCSFPPLALPNLERIKDHIPLNPFVVLAPGGAKNYLAEQALRRWPISSYQLLIKRLQDKGASVLITGSENDEWVTSYLEGLPVNNLIGKLSLLEMVSLLNQAALFITHDSGPLHLAKLAKCPTIALFGPTNPAEFASGIPWIEVIWGGEDLGCRPCYDGKTFPFCSHKTCLAALSVERVLETFSCRQFLEKSNKALQFPSACLRGSCP